MAAAITGVSYTNYLLTHRVVITTTADNTQPTNFFGYRLYRQSARSARELVAQRTTFAGSYAINDYNAPASDLTYQWVRVTTSGSTQVETILATSITTPPVNEYWLVHPTNRAFDTRLYSVTSEDFQDEIESEVINLIGRGRKEDRGDVWGKTGSLSCQLRDKPTMSAADQRFKLEAASREPSWFYLFTPFGDRYKVIITPPSFDRLSGTGQSEFFDVDLEYTEVA